MGKKKKWKMAERVNLKVLIKYIVTLHRIISYAKAEFRKKYVIYNRKTNNVCCHPQKWKFKMV